jgi:hypothetical protein
MYGINQFFTQEASIQNTTIYLFMLTNNNNEYEPSNEFKMDLEK